MEWGVSDEGAELSSADSGGGNGRVLVVDDTEQIRHLIRVNLELEGYKVMEASDGAGRPGDAAGHDPAAAGRHHRRALMPRRDGWWTVSMIRADPRLESIPIVMVTASVQPHHRAQAEQAAVDGFVAKPFEPDELLALIGILAVGGRV